MYAKPRKLNKEEEKKVLIGPPKSGKTTELIKLSAKEGGYIVCRSFKEVDQIAAEAKMIGLNIPFPMTYREAIEHNGRVNIKIYINDLLCFAMEATRLTIEAVTFETEASLPVNL